MTSSPTEPAAGATLPSQAQPWTQFYQPDAAFDPDDLLAPSLAQMIKNSCLEHDDRAAFSCMLPNGSHASLSYVELDAQSDNLAFYLRRELGLQPGDVVALQSPNCLAYPVVAYGVLKAGLMLTNINPLYTERETAHQLQDSRAKALFVVDLFGDRVAPALDGSDVVQVIRLSIVDLFPPAQRALIGAYLKYVQRLVPPMKARSVPLIQALKVGEQHRKKSGDRVERLFEHVGLDDVAVFQYTSGTTGRSKGAELTQRNLIANLTQSHVMTGHMLRQQQEQTILVLPLYHVYALVISAMAGMRLGTHTVLIPNPRPLVNLKPAFEKFPPTYLPGINTLFQGLLREDWFIDNPPDTMRFCFSGAAPLQQATAEAWQEVTGARIFEGYGLTEGTCVVASSTLDERTKPGTVGIPIPGTEIKLVDGDGREVPAGERGEVVIRGPQVMKGYLGRPEATAETIKDGWLHTGDIGIFDEDGFLSIVDRKKDMIIVSGFNVYPAEVEDALATLDGVGEVAVIGMPSDETGEAVRAYVVRKSPTLSEDDVIAHAREYLTNYKRPRQVVFVDELPKSPVGKVLRRELRDMAVAEG